MLLLEDKQRPLIVYFLPNYPEQTKAIIQTQLWDNLEYPTLHYIEVAKDLRGQGLGLQLLNLIMQKHNYLRFMNHNDKFWKHLATKDLKYTIRFLDENQSMGEIKNERKENVS